MKTPLSDTRSRIKKAARKLFAERGVEAGTVRDIVAAAGAKNGGSLNYYFGSKDELVSELVSDVIRATSEAWLRALGDLERRGGPASVRDVVSIMVLAPRPLLMEDPEPTAARFLASVLFTRRRMVRELMKRMDYAVLARLLNYIAELRPDIPAAVMRQRLIFLAWYVISIEAALEASAASGRKSREWGDYDPLINLADTATGLIEAPITEAESKIVKPRAARKPRSAPANSGAEPTPAMAASKRKRTAAITTQK